MTRFADPLVLICPHCGDHVLRRRLASFNNFGAVYWSDGYASILGLEATSPFGVCPWCKQAFWMDDAGEVGVLPRQPPEMSPFWRLIVRLAGDERGDLEAERVWKDVPWEWKSAKVIEPASLNDYRRALSGGPALDEKREMFIRTRLWWRGNDQRRRSERRDAPGRVQTLGEAEERGNLMALHALLARNPDRVGLKLGEVLRELGRFEEAIEVLRTVEESQRAWAQGIIGFAEEGDPVVREVGRSEFCF